MSAKRKVNSLTIGDKFKIIQAVKAEERKKKDITAEFNIPSSTLSTILKNEAEILKRVNKGNLQCKRKREAEFPDVEKCMVELFKQSRDKNITLGGSTFERKGRTFC